MLRPLDTSGEDATLARMGDRPRLYPRRVDAAYIAYRVDEELAWAEYESRPCFMTGRRYLEAEARARARRERAVERARYRDHDEADTTDTALPPK